MAELSRKVFVLGLGAVGVAFLELARRAGFTRDFEVAIITDAVADRSVLGEDDLRLHLVTLTKDNLAATLERLVPRRSVIVNCLAAVASIDVMSVAAARGCLYIDTSVENWDGEEVETHERQAVILDHRHRFRDAPPLVINQGANPGLVSHFVKAALESEHALSGCPRPRTWAEMARDLGVVAVHVSEVDDQVAAIAPRQGHFYGTWSVESFRCESLETSIHALGHGAPTSQGRVVALPDGYPGLAMPSNGMCTFAHSFTPARGRYLGFVMSHVETFTIAAMLTHRSEGRLVYRPSVLFSYRPCPLTIWSLRQPDWMRNRPRLLMTEIVEGADELGVTLFRGPERPLIWFGSTLSERESRRHSPRSNATSVQVAAGLYAGLLAALESRRGGVLEPEDLDHRFILEKARPYLGALRREAGPAGAIDPHFVFSAPVGAAPLLDPRRDRAVPRPPSPPRIQRAIEPLLAEIDPIAACAPIERWLDEYGSPLMIYSRTGLHRLAEGFRDFAGQVGRPARIAFAMKACPAPVVLGLMRSAGFEVEINALTEYRRAVSAGFDPGAIRVNGIAKSPSFLDTVLREGCSTIHIEAVDEIDRIAALARARGRRQDVHLRLCPQVAAAASERLATGGAHSKFGILVSDLPAAIAALHRAAGVLRLVGLHVHVGSGGRLAEVYGDVIAAVTEATACLERSGFGVREVNLGGGFVGAAGQPCRVADGAAIAAAIRRLPTRLSLAFEPGRFLVEAAASMFCRVAGIKRKGEAVWLLLDCGYAQLTDLAIVGARYPIRALGGGSGGGLAVRIGGPLCDSADAFRPPDRAPAETLFRMPARLRRGDAIEIGRVGAYVYGTGNAFCGTTQPAVLLMDETGVLRPIRRAEAVSDLAALELA